MPLFPPNVIDAAIASEKTSGCPAVLTLAQWALESGYGKYDLGANNFFGIKWFKSSKFSYVARNTKEVYNGKTVVIVAKFIRFPSMQACFEYHGKLLFTKPYAKAAPFAHDWKQFLEHIAPVYATDPHYKDKLLTIISSNDLVGLVAQHKESK